MTKNKILRIVSVTLIFALLAAMALSLSGCAKEEKKTADTASADSITVIVEIVDNEEKSKEYTISLPVGSTLWDALEKEKLAEASDSEFGKYIHTVNGLRADYDADGAYWALYKGGEYLMTGAESTILEDGGHYELVYTIG